MKRLFGRRAFLAGVFGAVAGVARGAELIDNGPAPKPAKIDNGPSPKTPGAARPAAVPMQYRQPIGHTHTCSAGHTWDHTLNPSHTCQICGRSQFVWDDPAKMVPVRPAPQFQPAPAAEAPAERSVEPVFTLPGSGSGCVNGNCPSTSSRGFFRRR